MWKHLTCIKRSLCSRHCLRALCAPAHSILPTGEMRAQRGEETLAWGHTAPESQSQDRHAGHLQNLSSYPGLHMPLQGKRDIRNRKIERCRHISKEETSPWIAQKKQGKLKWRKIANKSIWQEMNSLRMKTVEQGGNDCKVSVFRILKRWRKKQTRVSGYGRGTIRNTGHEKKNPILEIKTTDGGSSRPSGAEQTISALEDGAEEFTQNSARERGKKKEKWKIWKGNY